LTERKIGTEIYYPVSLHQQTCFADWGGQTGDHPHSEAAAAQTLAIPIYPELTDEQIQAVVNTIAEFYRG
jgi:dTDP-4-amino-4,6-dideoxygalactose transaminase